MFHKSDNSIRAASAPIAQSCRPDSCHRVDKWQHAGEGKPRRLARTTSTSSAAERGPRRRRRAWRPQRRQERRPHLSKRRDYRGGVKLPTDEDHCGKEGNNRHHRARRSRGPSGGIGNVVSSSTTAPSKEIQPGGSLTVLKAGEIAGFCLSPTPTRALPMDRQTQPCSNIVALHSGWHYQGPDRGLADSTDALVWTLKLIPTLSSTDGTPYDAAQLSSTGFACQDPANAAATGGSGQSIKRWTP